MQTPDGDERAESPTGAAPAGQQARGDAEAQVADDNRSTAVATEVRLPQLGESVTEGTITAWLVNVGDRVEADQPLFELSSDKIDTEVPAPTSGVLQEIKVQVDETVDVGTVVAIIATEDEQTGDGAAPAAEPAQPQEQEEPAPDEQAAEAAADGGDASAAAPVEEREEVALDVPDTAPQEAPAAEDEQPAPERAESAAAESGDGRTEGILASPLVRRMISEHDLDISSITPSGAGGRITRDDVEAAISGAKEAPAQPTARPAPARPKPERRAAAAPGERERVEDLSRVRHLIAAKMMESLQSSAQLTTVQEADVTRIMQVREQYKNAFREREGVSLSPFAFLCRAAVLVLRRPEHAMLNAYADWEAGKVTIRDYVNLGIAVDTEKGLLVPNIKRADDLTLPALARAIAEAADKARGRGKLEIQDIEGGTFTVTNTGSRGVLIDTPILNYPEVAILATGAIKKRPVVVSDETGDAIAVRQMMYLCLTYDHRLVDGADAARFVTDVAEVAETHDWEQELGY